jgi:hypothetical protein
MNLARSAAYSDHQWQRDNCCFQLYLRGTAGLASIHGTSKLFVNDSSNSKVFCTASYGLVLALTNVLLDLRSANWKAHNHPMTNWTVT